MAKVTGKAKKDAPREGVVWMPLNDQSAIMEADDLVYLPKGSPEERAVEERLRRQGLDGGMNEE